MTVVGWKDVVALWADSQAVDGPVSRRCAAPAALLGLPAAFVVLLAAQGWRALVAEYLPAPGYRVEATVGEGSGTVRLAVLGDSTVAGIGAAVAQESLPVLVAERVAARLGRPVHVVGHGVSGARTRDIAQQAGRLLGHEVDVVLAVIGSNDVTHATPVWTLRKGTAAMLDHMRQVAPRAGVVLGGVPEMGTVPALDWPLRWVAGRYAVLLREHQRAAAAAAGVPFVDIAADASPRFIGRPESMSADGFHPSAVGYGLWADALAPAVADAVDQRVTPP